MATPPVDCGKDHRQTCDIFSTCTLECKFILINRSGINQVHLVIKLVLFFQSLNNIDKTINIYTVNDIGMFFKKYLLIENKKVLIPKIVIHTINI